MKIVIIDGMGGGIGRAVAESLVSRKINAEIICVGTNSTATGNMLKAGGVIGATGENAIIYNCQQANIIIGPIGIMIDNSMYGEISPKIVNTVTGSRAKKILIPLPSAMVEVAGVQNISLNEKIEEAVDICIKSI